MWIAVLILLRTKRVDAAGAVAYGNLYSNLLDYVVFAALMFYVLTIVSVFVLRKKRPDAERPYKAFGYPVVPALYIIAASVILFVLLFYRTETAGWSLVIVLLGLPVYWLWSRQSAKTKLNAIEKRKFVVGQNRAYPYNGQVQFGSLAYSVFHPYKGGVAWATPCSQPSRSTP